jgi:hypothetical protein
VLRDARGHRGGAGDCWGPWEAIGGCGTVIGNVSIMISNLNSDFKISPSSATLHPLGSHPLKASLRIATHRVLKLHGNDNILFFITLD